MRVEKNSKTKLRSHFNTLAGFCTTSFQEQLSFSALAQRIYWQSAISSGLGIHFSGDDWSALGARRNCIYSYASLAIRITIASHAFLMKRPTQLERAKFRYY